VDRNTKVAGYVVRRIDTLQIKLISTYQQDAQATWAFAEERSTDVYA